MSIKISLQLKKRQEEEHEQEEEQEQEEEEEREKSRKLMPCRLINVICKNYDNHNQKSIDFQVARKIPSNSPSDGLIKMDLSFD